MSIMSIWEHPNPTANPTSPAEGKLTLAPSPFPPVLYPRRACRSLISSLSPLVVCSRRSLQAVRLLIPCYLPGDNSHRHLSVFPEASQLLWTSLHRSIELRAKHPFSKKPARETRPFLLPTTCEAGPPLPQREQRLPHPLYGMDTPPTWRTPRGIATLARPRSQPDNAAEGHWMPQNIDSVTGRCWLLVDCGFERGFAPVQSHAPSCEPPTQTPRRGGARAGDRKRLQFSAAV